MTLRGRITVEPLDDDRMTRIERRVVAGAADAAARGHGHGLARRFAGRAMVAAAMVAAGAVGWMLHQAPPSAPGVPSIADAAPVHLDTTAHAVLDIGDARIESDPATELTVTRPAGGVLVAMTRGKVELEVGKRHGRPPLVVRAGDTDVVVVGTHFTVDYGDGHGDVSVRVTEGVVRVMHEQKETRVAAGQAWRTHAGLIASAEPAPGEPLASAGPGAGEPAAEPPTAPGGDPALGSGHATVPVGTAPEVLHDRTAAVPVAPPALAPAPAPARPTATAPGHPLAGEAVRSRPAARGNDPQIDLRSAIRAQPVEPALDLGEPDPASAVAKYYAIAAHTSGADASQAFYSIAVIRHTRLGRNADALQALDAYVRRFPGGKEYRAALWLRVRILCLDKIDDRCRAAAYTYLHEAPDDPAAHVAELVTLTE